MHRSSADGSDSTSKPLDASALKAALAGSSGVLAVIASSWFFEEVVRHGAAGVAAAYRPVEVARSSNRAPQDPFGELRRDTCSPAVIRRGSRCRPARGTGRKSSELLSPACAG